MPRIRKKTTRSKRRPREPSKIVHLRVPPKLWAAFSEVAQRNGVGTAEFIRWLMNTTIRSEHRTRREWNEGEKSIPKKED